jgi:NodT family efflux transporter outer membrane factor (OMF) lipoprotein
VALNYVELRGYQTRLAIARSNLASQSETLQLTEWRTQAGLVGSLQLEQARANREQTRAQIPALETSLAQARNRLAVLTGQAPGAVDAQLAVATGIPAMPATLAVGIPAGTLRHRPDVRAAERLLAAETARVGQAQAARYPDFSLSGSIGLDAFTPGTLASGTVNRSLAASVGATIFDGGRLRQQVAVQDAVREQALYAYQAAVLTALEDVENALVAFVRSKERQAALDAAATAARQAAQLASQQYASGIIDFQTVLDTQRSVLALEDALAAAQADGATAVVQLYKALGGGWEPAATPPVTNDTTASHPP